MPRGLPLRGPAVVWACLSLLEVRSVQGSARFLSAGGCSEPASDANCSLCPEELQDLCEKGTFKGIPATLLAFEEDDLWGGVLDKFNGCTGARVTLTYTPDGEDGMQAALEADVGVSYTTGGGAAFEDEGAGIYDSYILQAPWMPSVVDGLENLSPRIAQAKSLDWLDVNAMSRQIVSFNSTVRALPLDTDYISFGYRADVFERWGKSPPETLEELVELSEFFNGKDHNADGELDWGFCLTPQSNYFYAFVAPVFQRTRAECDGARDSHGNPPVCSGSLTGQNPFFDVETFEPFIDNPGFRYAFDLHARFLRASNCQEQLFKTGKCDRKSAMESGRCAGVISMPGTMTKLLLPPDQGGNYAPQPRYAADGVTLEWEVNGTSSGGYWGRRVRFPGSSKVYDSKDGQLKDCTPALCPKAVPHPSQPDVLVNYAPFFAEGGEAYALRAGSASAKKNLMFQFFEWLANLPPDEVPLSGAYCNSQLTPEAQADMVARGMPEQVATDLIALQKFLFADDETEGANNVQDLLILGFAEYMEKFTERIYGTREEPALLLRHDIFNQTVPDSEFESVYAAAMAGLRDDYAQINAKYGKVAQLQRWRTSLGLTQMSKDQICRHSFDQATLTAAGIDCSPEDDGEEVLKIVLMTLWVILGVFFVAGAAIWLAFTVRTNRRLRSERLELVDRQVDDARQKVDEIQAPFSVMRGDDFLSFGQLVPYETARNLGKLVSVDTMGSEMMDFLKKHYIVFFSHQWLGWDEPDPRRVQYATMASALSTIAVRRKLKPKGVFAWCDWFSIPQKCRAVQKMAISSLPVFSSVCHCFVAVVPETEHVDSGDAANQAAYHSRAWCRAEVMSHWARRGTDNMFYARGTELVPMSQDGANDEFIEAIQVFHGEMTCCHHGHKGGAPCDREFLVLPMLGLYQQIHAERNDERMKKIHDVIEPFLDDVFPATFQYTSDLTGTVTKPLFGDLIQASGVHALWAQFHDRLAAWHNVRRR